MKTQNCTAILFAILSITACKPQDLDKDQDTASKAQTYHLVEKRQRVIRYNCQEQVTSARVETTQAPTSYMAIKPNSYVGLYSSNFENATLGTRVGAITNYTNFTIDLNPGALNLEVQTGINEIAYKFYYCSQRLPAPNEAQCAHTPELRESGSIFINVTYENIDVPGELILKPSPESCPPSK